VGLFAPGSWRHRGGSRALLRSLAPASHDDPHPFSSLMFFERRTQSSIKHRRYLRYLLLLSLRTLLLLLLALAFANPFIHRTAANMGNEKLLLLVIDNSFSMRAGTRLADARREALSVLSTRRPADRAQVMALGSQIQVLTQPSQDAGALRAAVESSNGRLSRKLWRTRTIAPFARGINSHAHRASFVQRHAKIRDAGELL